MASDRAIAEALVSSVWTDRQRYEEAESFTQAKLAQSHSGLKIEGKAIVTTASSEIRDVINQAKQRIEETLRKPLKPTSTQVDLERRVTKLEKENEALLKRVAALEKALSISTPASKETTHLQEASSGKKEADEDDDFDLFGSDEEEEEEETSKEKERALAAYKEKKSKKPPVIAKSSIILEVKPWDDETDMKELEKCVRSVSTDGLEWKASKLVPIAYGILKLQINCVVEDEKVGTDYLEEEIMSFADYVQSVDVVAFNKL